MHSKKKILAEIRKQTKPPKRFSQWILAVEHRRLSEDIGLYLVEAQLNGKLEWSGSISINLPEQKKYGPDGHEIPSEWDKVVVGQSRYNILSLEMRGKSVVEVAKGFIKRSFEEGKIQDIISLAK